MTIAVVLAREAVEQSRLIDEWWRENRHAAPELFAAELASALSLLAEAPLVGRRYTQAQAPGLRRLHLRRSRFHVYYSYDADASRVTIVTIWSAHRERPPL